MLVTILPAEHEDNILEDSNLQSQLSLAAEMLSCVGREVDDLWLVVRFPGRIEIFFPSPISLVILGSFFGGKLAGTCEQPVVISFAAG
jgi:hypothetical protein